MKNCESLLRDVQATSFLAHELQLYLDTHPGDREAFCAWQRALNARHEAVDAYEERVRALTPDGLRGHGEFDWADEPFPWQ